LKIIDRNANYTYFNSIIREHKETLNLDLQNFQHTKMRLDDDSGEKSLSFVFDNSLSYPSSNRQVLHTLY